MKKHLSTFAKKIYGSKWARVAVVAAIIATLLPSRTYSQLGLDPCCAIISAGLNVISGLLQNAVAVPLNSINQIQQQTATFEQKVIYPLAAINQAKSLAVQFQNEFVQMRQVSQLNVQSATLPIPQGLEQQLLSRNLSAIPQISVNYGAVYGKVIPTTDAPGEVRDLVDATDAEAQAAMKKAVEIDALADLELQAAEQINQQLQSAAPGSAPILEAQTGAWLVRANAYTQSAMAELVRVHSIELANHGAQLKFSTAHTVTLHDKTNQILGPAR
jgi:hypothetical protein